MREGGCSFGLHLRLPLHQGGPFLPGKDFTLCHAFPSLLLLGKEAERNLAAQTWLHMGGGCVLVLPLRDLMWGGFLLGGGMNRRRE